MVGNSLEKRLVLNSKSLNSTKLFVEIFLSTPTENEPAGGRFAAHGTVVEANLLMDRMSGRSRGFASHHCPPQEAPHRHERATLARSSIGGQYRPPQRKNVLAGPGPRLDFGGGRGGGAVADVAKSLLIIAVCNLPGRRLKGRRPCLLWRGFYLL